jgi:uncharacterized protein (DUF58 family)
VGLCAFADAVRAWVEPRAGKGHLRRLADAVTDEQALAEEPDYGGAARFLLTRQKKRAMVVVVTDVLDEHGARALTGALGVLRKRHVPVVVALSDPSFARLAHAEDADQAQRTAATRILEHRRRALSALRAARAHVVDVPAPKAAALAVDAYVAAKARV